MSPVQKITLGSSNFWRQNALEHVFALHVGSVTRKYSRVTKKCVSRHFLAPKPRRQRRYIIGVTWHVGRLNRSRYMALNLAPNASNYLVLRACHVDCARYAQSYSNSNRNHLITCTHSLAWLPARRRCSCCWPARATSCHETAVSWPPG